jgi:hypothetical protein
MFLGLVGTSRQSNTYVLSCTNIGHGRMAAARVIIDKYKHNTVYTSIYCTTISAHIAAVEKCTRKKHQPLFSVIK